MSRSSNVVQRSRMYNMIKKKCMTSKGGILHNLNYGTAH